MAKDNILSFRNDDISTGYEHESDPDDLIGSMLSEYEVDECECETKVESEQNDTTQCKTIQYQSLSDVISSIKMKQNSLLENAYKIKFYSSELNSLVGPN